VPGGAGSIDAMTVRRRLFELAHPASPAYSPSPVSALPTIDLGCGPFKRPGALGLDIEAGPGIDHVLDFEKERLPFDDGTVGYVFSSHCLEHLRQPMPVMRELTRVAADGAGLELWLPYGWHNEGQLVDHYVMWNEEQFRHMSELFPEIWWDRLGGGSWEIEELVFHIEATTLEDLLRHGDELVFALRHYRNVARELGVLGRIRKGPRSAVRKVIPRRTFVTSRGDTVRREVDAVGPLGQLRRLSKVE